MTLRRSAALFVAIFAVVVFVSIGAVIRDHLRRTSQGPPRDLANGTVLTVEPDGEAFSMLVEFEAPPGPTRHRFRAPAQTVGWLAKRPRQQAGDVLLVAYDPKDPQRAAITDIRSLWGAVVGRGLLSILLGVAALGLLLHRPSRQ